MEGHYYNVTSILWPLIEKIQALPYSNLIHAEEYKTMQYIAASMKPVCIHISCVPESIIISIQAGAPRPKGLHFDGDFMVANSISSMFFALHEMYTRSEDNRAWTMRNCMKRMKTTMDDKITESILIDSINQMNIG
jgi:hypothetical protein